MSKRAPLTFKVNKVTPASAATAQTELPETPQPSKRAKRDTSPGREGRVFIAAHVPPDAAKQFKLLAVQHDITTQDALIEAINDFFAKHGLSRIA